MEADTYPFVINVLTVLPVILKKYQLTIESFEHNFIPIINITKSYFEDCLQYIKIDTLKNETSQICQFSQNLLLNLGL